MRRGQPVSELTLTADERTTLERWVRRGKTAQLLAQMGRNGHGLCWRAPGGRQIRLWPVWSAWAGSWWGSGAPVSCQQRLDGLLDRPRSGAPRTVSDADVERVLARTLETMPRGATHWSTRSMARASGLSRSTINRIWRAFSLLLTPVIWQPHRTETFKLSSDPLFIQKCWPSAKVGHISDLN